MSTATSWTTFTAALALACTGCAVGPLLAPPALLGDLPAPAEAQQPAADEPAPEKPAADKPEQLPAPRPVEPPATRAGERPPPGTPGLPVGTAGRPLAGAALTLDRVLASVELHYPLIMAAAQDRVVADGRALAALGAFDLTATAAQYLQEGSYPSTRTNVGISQPTPFLGASLFAGYRIATGEFPVYYGERVTADGGEFRAGVQVPLLRDRALDRRRGAVAAAGIDRALAEPAVQQTRLDTVRAAARAYWTWVAAGQRFQIASEVLALARARDSQLARRVEAGNLAPIERVDNQRTIKDREARLVAAGRAYQAAAIALSLYLRDEAGDPLAPDAGALPPFPEPPPPPPPEQRAHDLDAALRQRPELVRLALQGERLALDLRLAENLLLPGVAVSLSGAQDVGGGKKDLDRATYEAALLVDVPLQRREARGRILETQGALGRLRAQERMARDRVYAEILDALSALERAWDLRQRAGENLELARRVEEGERTQFEAGKSDLFRVNIRELTRAEAQAQVVDALTEYYRALADYAAALGRVPGGH